MLLTLSVRFFATRKKSILDFTFKDFDSYVNLCKLIYKFNYSTLAMRHYIYSNKINSKAIYMHEFINKLSLKYSLEISIKTKYLK